MEDTPEPTTPKRKRGRPPLPPEQRKAPKPPAPRPMGGHRLCSEHEWAERRALLSAVRAKLGAARGLPPDQLHRLPKGEIAAAVGLRAQRIGERTYSPAVERALREYLAS
jgi:hypothetical protein